ncbi:MAG: hypothetical protein LIP05_05600 [Tannerellaceae bacterium]|nr:hypothetical protein [Tannerellaceae bacterium]
MEKIFYVEKQKASHLYKAVGNREFRYIELTGKETKKEIYIPFFSATVPKGRNDQDNIQGFFSGRDE